jgi:hypothetical protein
MNGEDALLIQATSLTAGKATNETARDPGLPPSAGSYMLQRQPNAKASPEGFYPAEIMG